MSKRGRPKHPDILTPREWEVLGHIREGLSNGEIASCLGISIDGVKFHVSEILGKLGVENRREAARWRPEEARPWWLTAAAPLFFWRRLGFGWLSPALAGGLAVAVAAGVGLLVWALLATRGGGRTMSVPPPVGLPEGDRVAYIGEDRNIWLLDGAGLARRLTEDRSVGAVRLSPDSRRVLFLDLTQPGSSLWIADIKSGLLSELRPPDGRFDGVGRARWAPDGQRVAFLAGLGGEHSGATSPLWTADVDGSSRLLVAANFRVNDFAWSPDGETLAIARTLPVVYPEPPIEPSPQTIGYPEETGVYLIDADGGEPEPLVLLESIQRAYAEGERRAGVERRLSGLGVVGAGFLQWSPDARYVAFQASLLSASASADGEALFTLPVDGGPPVYHGIMLRSETLLDWFPDGSRFVFTLGGGREVYLYKCLAIAQAGVAGAQSLRDDCERDPRSAAVEPSARSDAWPAVSPDGSRIAFQASDPSAVVLRLDVGKAEGPGEGIWVVDADGSNPRQLTSDPGYLDFLPRWSADGELIMFVRTDGQPFAGDATPEGSPRAEIWLMRSDGSEAEPLLTDLQRGTSYYGLFQWEAYIAWHRAPGGLTQPSAALATIALPLAGGGHHEGTNGSAGGSGAGGHPGSSTAIGAAADAVPDRLAAGAGREARRGGSGATGRPCAEPLRRAVRPTHATGQSRHAFPPRARHPARPGALPDPARAERGPGGSAGRDGIPARLDPGRRPPAHAAPGPFT